MKPTFEEMMSGRTGMKRPEVPESIEASKKPSKTAMEKTSDAAKELIDTETQKRDAKTAALRKARMARDKA
ncbi:hypothetical protein GGQ68_000705 [Sagittula marina]|uniref:Uncharacterized protein n=1 Tax=Sagittula marina TaxID=943940 RepID=A0A7W6DSJ2_9RHOB|nr:hypothetical protein [Sagittula marina]MBB3984389.1 hypothetical protein [Sagittula marina]